MPTVFPIVLSKYHCFSSIFDGFCFFLGFVLTFFTPDPAKSQKTFKMVRNTIPGLFPFVLCVFSHCFDGFCAFFWLRSHLFHLWPCKKSGNLEIGCRFEHCWALLSASECCWECCWVLLSAAECCWVLLGNPIPSLFPFVLCVFSHCFVQISFFSKLFEWILHFFWFRSHLFHPWPWKKSGNLEIGCRFAELSAAECCWVLLSVLLCAAEKSNSPPSSICFVCVCSHCFCPFFIVVPQFLVDFVVFVGFVFSSFTRKKLRKLRNLL